MPKPSFGEVVAGVPDPMLSDNFSLEVPNVPGGFSANPLYISARTAAKPGFTIEAVEVQLFGHTVEHAGRYTYSHDMNVEYVENRKAEIHTIIEGWGGICRSPDSQHGEYKNVYSTTAYLKIYDQKGLKVKEYEIIGFWPSSFPESPFDGSSANVITLSVGFKYDKWRVR